MTNNGGDRNKQRRKKLEEVQDRRRKGGKKMMRMMTMMMIEKYLAWYTISWAGSRVLFYLQIAGHSPLISQPHASFV